MYYALEINQEVCVETQPCDRNSLTCHIVDDHHSHSIQTWDGHMLLDRLLPFYI